MAREKLICDCDVIHQDILKEVSRNMPKKGSFDRLSLLYKAFSDPTRLRILWALKCHEMCVCDLAVLLNMTKSAISHQLKVLRLSQLVKYEKAGKIVYYSLADGRVADVLACGLSRLKG